MTQFSLSMTSKAGLDAQVSEYIEEMDVIEFLSFDSEQVETLLESHAAHQAYWEALAVKLTNRHEAFEKEWCRKWWAHNKTFARYVLSGYGDNKPTIDSIKDMVILIYSEDVSDTEKGKFSSIAYSAASKGKKDFPYTEKEFTKNMYKYVDMDPPWYFETIMRTLNKMKEDSELIQTVAKKLDSRSYHIGDLTEFISPKKGNVGPMRITESEMIRKINKERKSK